MLPLTPIPNRADKVLLGACYAPFEVHAFSLERVKTILGMTELLAYYPGRVLIYLAIWHYTE
jgi:hypothetical protein